MSTSTGRHTIEQIKKQLRAVGATNYQLSRPEISVLPGILFDNESIKAYVLGYYEGGYGMLVATEYRMIFLDKMFTGKVVVDDIPYSMISSTEFSLGMFYGSITIFCRPKNYRFWWLSKQNVRDFYDYVEQQMLIHQKEHFEEVNEN